MNNLQTERKAIYNTAAIFTDFGWIFREQPLVGYGIDALVETTKNGRPNAKFIALQIKGGEHNFHRKKECLTFYFKDSHYNYWSSINETLPLIIILEDPVSHNIYWKLFSAEESTRTSKHWKINISKSNILNVNSIETINQIIIDNTNVIPPIIEKSWLQQNTPLNEKIKFYLDKKKSELHLSIKLSNKTYKINFKYIPKSKNWNNTNEELESEDRFYFTFRNLRELIQSKINNSESDDELINLLKTIKSIIKDKGIEKVDEFLFDIINEKHNLPKFENFIEAFEHHMKLNKEDYVAKPLDQIVLFKTDNEVYEMDTYEGKTAQLKYLIEDRAYDEIYTMTNDYIWNEMYIDAGIEKSKFIPVMLNLWESYWEELFIDIKEQIGYTSHLEKQKDRSWRELNTFFKTYNDTCDIINLAYEIDEMRIYPLAVLTMMSIFNPEVCYGEYCELEFDFLNEWESICVNDDDMNSPIFHIRTSELY